jgi:DHA1 family multidrug resistance protein-like MFS transporter
MHDLFPDLTVPYSLAIWIAAAYCGPALGPLIASYLVPEKDWRWGMWEIVWLAAPTLVLMVTLPETHGPTIRARRSNAADRSSSTGNVTARAIATALKDTIVRPVQITLQDPAVAVANLYTAFMYGTYYNFFDAILRVYPERYGFTIGQLGLAFLSIFVACVVGGAAYCFYVYKTSISDREHLPTTNRPLPLRLDLGRRHLLGRQSARHHDLCDWHFHHLAVYECIPASDLPGILGQFVCSQRLVPVVACRSRHTPWGSVVW